MKNSKRMMVVILLAALILIAKFLTWYFKPDRATWQDAVIDVYIKIVCEK